MLVWQNYTKHIPRQKQKKTCFTPNNIAHNQPVVFFQTICVEKMINHREGKKKQAATTQKKQSPRVFFFNFLGPLNQT